MTFPSDLHELVDQLAIATKKLKNIQEEVDKLPPAQELVDRLRLKLVGVLDSKGFTEDAVDLLLAAR